MKIRQDYRSGLGQSKGSIKSNVYDLVGGGLLDLMMMRVVGNILQAKDRSQVLKVESFEECEPAHRHSRLLATPPGEKKKDLLVHLLQKNQAVLERNMAPN